MPVFAWDSSLRRLVSEAPADGQQERSAPMRLLSLSGSGRNVRLESTGSASPARDRRRH
jgi:hypothetical protein